MIQKSSKKYWFRTKTYGWGWTPCSWQGWAITLLYIALVAVDGYNISYPGIVPSRDELISFYLCLTVSTIGLLWIVYRTGEKPRWRWGK
jgi:hypothetical protein